MRSAALDWRIQRQGDTYKGELFRGETLVEDVVIFHGIYWWEVTSTTHPELWEDGEVREYKAELPILQDLYRIILERERDYVE